MNDFRQWKLWIGQLIQAPEPFFREAGAGLGVVCLHANASTSAQWRNLVELLDSEFHVLTADSYGAGTSPDWPMDRRISLYEPTLFAVIEEAPRPRVTPMA
jgi:hypothetical protein